MVMIRKGGKAQKIAESVMKQKGVKVPKPMKRLDKEQAHGIKKDVRMMKSMKRGCK